MPSLVAGLKAASHPSDALKALSTFSHPPALELSVLGFTGVWDLHTLRKSL